jgi:hypothetical protein
MKPQTKLERYLKQASRGIWGKKKLEVINELRGNIESRVWMLEQQGFSSFQALEMALEELGKPSEINAGMVKVHAMPKMFKALVVAAMLSSLAVVNVNLSTAQVAGASELPIDQCSAPTVIEDSGNIPIYQFSGKFKTCIGGFWFKISDLKNVLEPLGVTYERREGRVSLIQNHVFIFPGNIPLVIQPASTFEVGKGTNPEISTNIKSDAEYLPGSSLFKALSEMNVPTKIEGFEIPKITIGSISFTFGTAEKPINALSLYGQVFQKNMFWQYFPIKSANEALSSNIPGGLQLDDGAKFNHYLKIKDSKPGSIYVLVYRSQYSYPTSGFPSKTVTQPYKAVDVSPMFKTGFLIFRTPMHKLEYTTNPEKLDRFNSNSETGKVTLLRFNGTLNHNAKSFEIVPANQIVEVKHPGR